ncbi:MAG: hypothetical protein IJM44_05440 [Ruminococcus sp.]|nr:hypothetical protein [Ruminococcus sp.]
MEELKASVVAVCAVSGAICAVENLIAGTGLKTQMRLLMSLVLMLTVITPFVRGGIDIELPEAGDFGVDIGWSQEIYREELARQTAENVCEVLRGQIEAAGVSCGEISAEVNISEDMSISISRVTVSAEDFDAAAEIVRSCLGSGTEVCNGDT